VASRLHCPGPFDIDTFDIDTRGGAMKTRDEHIDRILGYLGLFIIGALGWTADRLGEVPAAAWARPAARPKTSHGISRART